MASMSVYHGGDVCERRRWAHLWGSAPEIPRYDATISSTVGFSRVLMNVKRTRVGDCTVHNRHRVRNLCTVVRKHHFCFGKYGETVCVGWPNQRRTTSVLRQTGIVGLRSQLRRMVEVLAIPERCRFMPLLTLPPGIASPFIRICASTHTLEVFRLRGLCPTPFFDISAPVPAFDFRLRPFRFFFFFSVSLLRSLPRLHVASDAS